MLRRRPPAGFTLIEMVLTIVITGAVFAIGATVMSTGFRNYFMARESNQNDWQGRLALERMLRDLRAARTPTAADLTLGASTLTFVDLSGNSIFYRFISPEVTRSVNGGVALTVVDNANSLSFTYLQSDASTVATLPQQVYYITVQLRVRTQNADATYRTTVKPASY